MMNAVLEGWVNDRQIVMATNDLCVCANDDGSLSLVVLDAGHIVPDSQADIPRGEGVALCRRLVTWLSWGQP